MPSDATLSRAARIASSTWSDALDRLRIAGCVQGLAWRSGRERVAGRAVTVREEVGPLGSFRLEHFDVGAIIQAAGAGEILVIDLGGAEVSTFGGLAAGAAINRGIAGVVVDGGCRDLEEIQQTGLAVVSRHVTPVSGKERARVANIGERVLCGGIDVSPADIVIADATGTVIVPAPRFGEALDLAEQLADVDRRFQQGLDAGQEFGALARSLRHL